MNSRVVAVCLSVFFCMAVGRAREMSDARIFKNESGESLPYRLYKPYNCQPGIQYPLVLSLHGAGGRAKQLAGITVFDAKEDSR